MRNCAYSIYREDWELTDPKKWKWTLSEPLLTKVVVHFNSHTHTCTWYDHCVATMQELYKKYLKLGLPDMPYNFVVGADGEAYCGRGWNKQSDSSLPYPEFLGRRLDILMFGDWTNTVAPEPLRDKLVKLINYGVKYGRIAEDYDLLMVDNNLWDGYSQKYANITKNIK